MLTYIIKSIACSLLFWLLYKAVFEREKMLKFNRFYLLAAMAASFVIPLVTFTVTVWVPAAAVLESVLPELAAATETGGAPEGIGVVAARNYTDHIIWGLYAAVGVALLARFVLNLRSIRRNISNGAVRGMGGAKLVLADPHTAPNTFMNYIFVPRDAMPEEEILCHELAHAEQRHSIDKLILETLSIVFWFNPVLLLYRKAINLNHEYLADEAVLERYHNVVRYQTLLIRDSDATGRFGLANNFSFLTTKKRLIMMTKNTSRGMALLKQSTVIPLCALALGLFANRVTATETTLPETSLELLSTGQTPQTGATQAQMDEFKKLAAKGTTKNGEIYTIETSKYSEAELIRMRELYQLMSPEQQSLQDSYLRYIHNR